MEIKWIGQSSFLITDSRGIKIITDPFDESIGYKVFNEHADIVTISHNHFDHNCTKYIKGNFKVINKTGNFIESGIKILGIPSFHDKCRGAKRGNNIIFTFEIDGFRICHLGDLGHYLSSDDMEKIGNIDVLFIPVGGNYTIDGKEASEIAKKINSHIVIPMHYKTPVLNLPLAGAEAFLSHMKNCEKINDNKIILKNKISDSNKVEILDYTH